MTPFFSRRVPITPAFVTAPAELPDVAQSIASIDERLELIKLTPKAERNVYIWALADRLLDQRLAIRPARPAQVPVIPGRPS